MVVTKLRQRFKGTSKLYLRDIVLIHGLGDTPSVWEPITPYLSDRFKVHTLFLPGHSKLNPILDLASALEGFIGAYDSLNVHEPLVVGHSAGAVFAIVLSTIKRLSGLVLLDQPLTSTGLIPLKNMLKNIHKNDVSGSLGWFFLRLVLIK